MRIILDTSTILAHLLSRGKNYTVEIFKLVKQKKITLIASKETIQELKTKLSSEKIKKLPYYRARINAAFVAWYQYNTEVYVISSTKSSRIRDSKDIIFIQLAKVSRADFLISGDKDLLVLKSVNSTNIVKPQEFLAYM